MDFYEVEDVEIIGYNEDVVDQFISMNDIDVDKALIGMPETLRSMFSELTFIGSIYLNPKMIKRFEESRKMMKSLLNNKGMMSKLGKMGNLKMPF